MTEYQEYLKHPLSPLVLLRNGIAELTGTKGIEAISCKITDSLEVGMAEGDGQVAIDQVSVMDDPGVTVTHIQTRALPSTAIGQHGYGQRLPVASTDGGVGSFSRAAHLVNMKDLYVF
jgi:hypothetical protein